MNESPKSELRGSSDKGAVVGTDLAAAVSQQLASVAAANQQAAGGASLPSDLDSILWLAVKHQQQQQLLQHQRQLQQLQHLQHLQQIQQQQQQQQQQQNQQRQQQQQQQQQASAAVAAAAAAAAAAFQQHQQQLQQQQAPTPHHPHHHAAAVAAAAAAVHQQHPHHHNTSSNNNHHHHHHRRQYNPAATLHYLATNECRVIDYRGHRIAAFLSTPNPAMLHHLHRTGQQAPKPNQTEHLLCLPQAFEVFLKHLVGGLHTVYTKLKRLDIVPIVCNVEQVRILRGLGAIQPGVNRCKLLSTHDFDILFKDCTTARPGRPPKRSPVGDALSSASGSPTRDDSRTGTPSQSELDSASSLIGVNSSSDNNNNSRTQQQQSAQHNLSTANSLVSALTTAANNVSNLNSSSLMSNSGLASSQPSIDLSALAQHLHGNNSSGGNNALNITSTTATTPSTATTTTSSNSLNALLDTGLLTSKLAQQQQSQHLIGSAGNHNTGSSTGNNCTNSSLLANGANSLFSTLSQQQAMAAAVQNATIPSLNPATTAPSAVTNSHQTAQAAANLYQSPNLLNDVWLLLALVQQQLNQQIQVPGAGGAHAVAPAGIPNASQLLQQQLQAQLQIMQQQQQLAGGASATESAASTTVVGGNNNNDSPPNSPTAAANNENRARRSPSVDAAETSGGGGVKASGQREGAPDDWQLVSNRRKSIRRSHQDRRHVTTTASPATSPDHSRASSATESPIHLAVADGRNADRMSRSSFSFDESDDEAADEQSAQRRKQSSNRRSSNQTDGSRPTKRTAQHNERDEPSEAGDRRPETGENSDSDDADTDDRDELASNTGRLFGGDSSTTATSRRTRELQNNEHDDGASEHRQKRTKRSHLDQNNIGKRNFGFANEMSADEEDEGKQRSETSGDHWNGNNQMNNAADESAEKMASDPARQRQTYAIDASATVGQLQQQQQRHEH